MHSSWLAILLWSWPPACTKSADSPCQSCAQLRRRAPRARDVRINVLRKVAVVVVRALHLTCAEIIPADSIGVMLGLVRFFCCVGINTVYYSVIEQAWPMSMPPWHSNRSVAPMFINGKRDPAALHPCPAVDICCGLQLTWVPAP